MTEDIVELITKIEKARDKLNDSVSGNELDLITDNGRRNACGKLVRSINKDIRSLISLIGGW